MSQPTDTNHPAAAAAPAAMGPSPADREAQQPHSPRVATMSEELRRTIFSCHAPAAVIAAVLEHALGRRELYGAGAYVDVGDRLRLTAHRARQPCWQTALEMDQAVGGCAAALAANKTQIVEIPGARPCSAICIPAGVAGADAIALLAAGRKDGPLVAGEAIIAEILAVHLRAWRDRQRVGELSRRLSSTAAVLELVRRVESSADPAAAGFEIVGVLQEHLRCEQVVLGLCGRRRGCRVTAISGVADVDENSVLARRFKAVLEEALTRDQFGAWPPLPDAGGHQLLAHKQLAGRDESVVSVPLKDSRGQPVGALAVRGPRAMAATPEVCNFVRTLDEPLGSALQAVRKIQGGWLRRVVRGIAPGARKRRAIIATLVLAALLALALPMPYRVACRSVVEPVERRFCVAPHDGLMENTLAEPGDMVHEGQLLAHMDGREVRLELAAIDAEIHRAAKQRDSHQARHEVPDALMAGLEIERLEARAQLLKLRQSGLDVASPATGVVLSGSLDRRENVPVTKGQVLYEIAPLHPLRIEAGVPAAEIAHVAEGMAAEVRFEGLPGESFAGKVRSVRPRSEIRDEQNVFVAEIEIDNRSGRIRPGMQGKAKITSAHRSIGWILFHRAGERLQMASPW